jgi:hypothetical protein
VAAGAARAAAVAMFWAPWSGPILPLGEDRSRSRHLCDAFTADRAVIECHSSR